jgi:hypothetical protein
MNTSVLYFGYCNSDVGGYENEGRRRERDLILKEPGAQTLRVGDDTVQPNETFVHKLLAPTKSMYLRHCDLELHSTPSNISRLHFKRSLFDDELHDIIAI